MYTLRKPRADRKGRGTAGLAIALFNHHYIWVHYFATERPDMEEIYG